MGPSAAGLRSWAVVLVAAACLGTTAVGGAVEERPTCGVGPHAYGGTRGVPEGSASSNDPDIIRLGGSVRDIVLTDDFVYVLHDVVKPYAPRTYRTESAAVSRVDRRSREVVRGDPVPDTFHLAKAGGSLWAYGVSYDEAHNECAGLYRIDPRTLRVVDEVRLPEPPPRSAAFDDRTHYGSSAIEEAPDGRHLWVALGRHLHRLDARTGRIVETEVSYELIEAVAVDPKGRHFYSFSSDYSSPNEGSRVTKRHIDHGTVQRRSALLSGGPELTASRRGVWMEDEEAPGSATRPPRRGLRLIDGDELEPRGRAGPGQEPSNAAVSGDTLWFSGNGPADGSGRATTGGLYCADADTGALRFDEPQGPGGHSIVADDKVVYLSAHGEIPDEEGIRVVDPERACLE